MWRSSSLLVLVAAWCVGQEMGEVRGTVVDGATGQGIAGAKVVLFRETPGGGYSSKKIWDAALGGEDAGSEVLAALTGDQGGFRFRVTAPAEFRVFASCDGYVKTGMEFGTERTVQVKAGGEGLRVELTKEGSISGRVVDAETGLPLSGLRVTPKLWQTLGDTRALLIAGEAAVTGADGAYALKGLRPGEYVLEIEPARPEKFLDGGTAEEFRAVRVRGYGRSYHPGVERVEEVTPLVLLAGGALDGSQIRMAMRRVASIRGRVTVEEDSGSIEEVALMLGSIEYQGGAASYGIEARGKVAVGQTFRLDGVAPGRYWLSGSAKGPLGAFAFFEVDDRNVDGVDLVLRKGLTVRGTVRMEETLERALPREKKLSVSLQPRGRASYSGEGAAEVSVTDGSFVKTGVRNGEYRVRVAGLPKGLALGAVRYNGALIPLGIFTPNAGALDQKLELVVQAATASIMVSAKGAGVFVAIPEEYDRGDRMMDSTVAEGDGAGRATIANLKAGRYRLLAFAAGTAWRSDARLKELVMAAKVVELMAGGTVTAELKVAGQ